MVTLDVVSDDNVGVINTVTMLISLEGTIISAMDEHNSPNGRRVPTGAEIKIFHTKL